MTRPAPQPSPYRPVALPDGYTGWIPAVATYPGCGGLTPYMYGAALAHAQVFDMVAWHGRSGGAIAAALVASRVPIDRAVAMCDAWDPTIALRQSDTKGWRQYIDLQGRGNSKALEEFLDHQLGLLGHSKWGDFRYDSRPPGIGFDHRLQVGLCYVDVPAKRMAEVLDNEVTFLKTLMAARSPRLKTMIFPRDVPTHLPQLADSIDELSVAEWLVNSSRHPGQFKAKAIRMPEGHYRMIFDGAVRCTQPFLFPNDRKQPYAQVTFRHDGPHDDPLAMRVQAETDLHAHPWTMINRGKPPCRSFDIEKLLFHKEELVTRGYVDCAESMKQMLEPYLECMEPDGRLRTRVGVSRPLLPPVSPLVTSAAQRLGSALSVGTRVLAGAHLAVAATTSLVRPHRSASSSDGLSLGL